MVPGWRKGGGEGASEPGLEAHAQPLPATSPPDILTVLLFQPKSVTLNWMYRPHHILGVLHFAPLSPIYTFVLSILCPRRPARSPRGLLQWAPPSGFPLDSAKPGNGRGRVRLESVLSWSPPCSLLWIGCLPLLKTRASTKRLPLSLTITVASC